jgi:hypothetical protein
MQNIAKYVGRGKAGVLTARVMRLTSVNHFTEFQYASLCDRFIDSAGYPFISAGGCAGPAGENGPKLYLSNLRSRCCACLERTGSNARRLAAKSGHARVFRTGGYQQRFC